MKIEKNRGGGGQGGQGGCERKIEELKFFGRG